MENNKNNKKVVVVLFGGVSSEHEVSIKSATSITKALNKDKYEVINIGITRKGDWYLYEGDADLIASGEWEFDKNNKKAFIVPDRSISGILVIDGDKYYTKKVDVVIPVLHGKNGEDGTMQGLLDISSIPYVGCKTLAAASCMDKVVTNILLKEAGIDQAEFGWFYDYQYKENPDECISIAEGVSNYPLFIKPANAGSSVGVSKVNNREELINGIEKAIKEDNKILIEECITGHEVECAVLGNEDPISSVVGEVGSCNEFYDYEAKYEKSSELYIPAKISEEDSELVRKTAVRAYKFLGCRGLTRMDFFVCEGNKVYLNEPNTFPGFTPISMYPKLFEKTGIEFSDLLDRIIDFAFKE